MQKNGYKEYPEDLKYIQSLPVRIPSAAAREPILDSVMSVEVWRECKEKPTFVPPHYQQDDCVTSIGTLKTGLELLKSWFLLGQKVGFRQRALAALALRWLFPYLADKSDRQITKNVATRIHHPCEDHREHVWATLELDRPSQTRARITPGRDTDAAEMATDLRDPAEFAADQEIERILAVLRERPVEPELTRALSELRMSKSRYLELLALSDEKGEECVMRILNGNAVDMD